VRSGELFVQEKARRIALSDMNPRRVSECCIGEFKHGDGGYRNAKKPTI